jgi:diguanylate cyclase (GGDEF)-like protein
LLKNRTVNEKEETIPSLGDPLGARRARRRIILVAVVAIAAWTAFVSLLLGSSIKNAEENTFHIALVQARAFFQQVVDVRSWNASHGGVYVPATAETPPNPYLDVPERDLETSTGRKLTLVNPAYMTRQIAEGGMRKHGIAIHITSLKPIRPANVAADWERAALLTFEEGAGEHAGFFSGEEGTAFRYMAPLMVEESCLRCHEEQGYRKGDVRGGISVSIPGDVLAGVHTSRTKESILAALIVWLVGVGIVVVAALFFLEKQRMVEKLRELSLEDSLTGLKNRRGFMNLCGQEMEIARRWNKKILLLFIDIDSFKEINDTFGHAEGDEALRAVARAVKASFRDADVTSRFGGDEFALFCLGSSLENTDDLIRQLRRNLERENSLGEGKYRLSFSAGAAEFHPESGATFEELMAIADADMYEHKHAKKSGERGAGRKENGPLYQD